MRWNAGLAALAASWGLIAVIVSAVDLGAASLAFLRLALAAVTLACVALVRGGLRGLGPAGRLGALTALGIAQGAHWLLFFAAVKEGSVALAVLTFYTAPLFIALAAPRVLGERVSRLALGAFVVGAVGVVLVVAGGEGGGWSAAAVAAGLGSALTYAVLVLLSKQLLHGDVPPLTVAFWDCAIGAVAVAPALLVAGRVVPATSGEWMLVLLLGIVFTGLSTLVYVSLLRRVAAQTAGILTFLEPVSAVLLAWAFLDERPGAATLVGGTLVLVAGVAVVLFEPADVPVAEAPPAVGSTA